jgi:hypothetical protein
MPARVLKDRRAPYALLIAGVTIILGNTLIHHGPVDAIAAFGWLAIWMIIGVGAMAIACLITARLLGTSFGELGGAVLKLAAIFVLPTAVTVSGYLSPWWSTVISTALYFGLLLWLFDLEVYEAAVFTLVMLLIRWAIFAFISGRLIPLST